MTLGKPFCRSGDVSSASDAAKDAVVDAAAVAAAADVRSRDVRTSRLRRTYVLLFAGVVFDTLSLTQKRSLTQTQYLTFSSTVSFVSGLSLSHMYISLASSSFIVVVKFFLKSVKKKHYSAALNPENVLRILLLSCCIYVKIPSCCLYTFFTFFLSISRVRSFVLLVLLK